MSPTVSLNQLQINCTALLESTVFAFPMLHPPGSGYLLGFYRVRRHYVHLSKPFLLVWVAYGLTGIRQTFKMSTEQTVYDITFSKVTSLVTR